VAGLLHCGPECAQVDVRSRSWRHSWRSYDSRVDQAPAHHGPARSVPCRTDPQPVAPGSLDSISGPQGSLPHGLLKLHSLLHPERSPSTLVSLAVIPRSAGHQRMLGLAKATLTARKVPPHATYRGFRRRGRDRPPLGIPHSEREDGGADYEGANYQDHDHRPTFYAGHAGLDAARHRISPTCWTVLAGFIAAMRCR
jgi:hypothetical protein